MKADSAVRSEITIAASAKMVRRQESWMASRRATRQQKRSAVTRRTVGGSTDGTIARIGGAATGEAAHGNKRRCSDKSNAAANEAARGYKFYRPHKLHSHLVAQIRF